MKFSDPSNNSGIFEEVKFQVGLDNDTNNLIYKKSDFTRHVNMAMDELFFLITKADQTWQWDDKRYTDLPIARTNLVANQRDYTFDSTHLKILKVEVQDPDDNWYILPSVDTREMKQVRDEYYSQPNIPHVHDKSANQIFLYPRSNYDKPLGLRVEFQRAAKRYLGDGTDDHEEPGFDAIFHEYVTLFCAYKYASSRTDLDKQEADFFNRIQVMKRDIQKHYGRRNEDRRKRLTVKRTPSW